MYTLCPYFLWYNRIRNSLCFLAILRRVKSEGVSFGEFGVVLVAAQFLSKRARWESLETKLMIWSWLKSSLWLTGTQLFFFLTCQDGEYFIWNWEKQCKNKQIQSIKQQQLVLANASGETGLYCERWRHWIAPARPIEAWRSICHAIVMLTEQHVLYKEFLSSQ